MTKFRYYCTSRSINDKDGRPYGIIWLTICTSYGNFRVLPVGFMK